MFDYIAKFNILPKELRDKVSTPQVMSSIEKLEDKYKVDLAPIVMKVMIKEVQFRDLVRCLVQEKNLPKKQALDLAIGMKKHVFFDVLDYLGGKVVKIQEIPKELKKAEHDGEGYTPLRTPGLGKKDDKNSHFYFSHEDEEEISALARKINKDTSNNINNDLEERLEEVIVKLNIRFGSVDLENRFRQILRSYLKKIRDRIQTKLTLSRPYEQGGLGFDSDSAEKIIKVADGHMKDDIDLSKLKAPKINLPEDEVAQEKDKDFKSLRKIGARDIEYDLKKELEKRAKDLDTEHELAPPPPAIIVNKAGKAETKDQKTSFSALKSQDTENNNNDDKNDSKIKITEKINKKEVVSETEGRKERIIDRPKIKEVIQPKKQGGKIKIEDVRKAPAVMGPIDELRYLDLKNFRRLSNDPMEAVEKISQKIKFLEEEKYTKRFDGIKAWRDSIINKLYLKIGEISMKERKEIGEVIELLKNAGKMYLSMDEMKAVMKLNKELRF